MLDLHLHSNFSDGKDSIDKLIENLKKRGIDTAALTDHDTLKSTKEFVKKAKENDINGIYGVELTTAGTDGSSIHIVGLNFDPDDKNLIELVNTNNINRRKRFEKIIQNLKNFGLNIEVKDVIRIAGNPESNLSHYLVAEALIEKNYNFLKKYLGEEPKASKIEKGLLNEHDAEFKKFTYTEVIKTIKNAGGIAVLAHPLEGHRKMIPDLVKAGLDGLEAFCFKINEEETKEVIELARKYNLLITPGSDYHGQSSRPIAGMNLYDHSFDYLLKELNTRLNIK